ncbi:hypothetical protein ABLN67_09625, partial [Mycobacterium tuberculosis]
AAPVQSLGVLTVSSIGGNGVFAFIVKRFRVFRAPLTLTVEPSAPLPAFWVNIARKKILHAATEGLRKQVVGRRRFTSG